MLFKKPTFFFAAAGVTAAALMVAHLNSQPPMPPLPIAAPTKPYVENLAASGIIEALSENLALGVPEAGLITQVRVKVWDRVEAGQPLIVLDDRELAAQLGVNEANSAVAAATLARLEAQLARLKGVADPRAVSEDEVLTKESDVAVARAQLAAASAQAEQTRVQLLRLTVVAPRAGTILQVNVRPGEYASVTPKTAPLVLGDVDRLQIRAEVDEQNATRFNPSQSATAYLKGDTTEPIMLRFVRIEPYVVPKVSLTGASTERVDTRVLQVIYAFERPIDRAVYVGQQVDLFVNAEPASTEARVAMFQTNRVEKGRL